MKHFDDSLYWCILAWRFSHLWYEPETLGHKPNTCLQCAKGAMRTCVGFDLLLLSLCRLAALKQSTMLSKHMCLRPLVVTLFDNDLG
eukprot:5583469-Amphidinium_carterae.1